MPSRRSIVARCMANAAVVFVVAPPRRSPTTSQKFCDSKMALTSHIKPRVHFLFNDSRLNNYNVRALDFFFSIICNFFFTFEFIMPGYDRYRREGTSFPGDLGFRCEKFFLDARDANRERRTHTPRRSALLAPPLYTAILFLLAGNYFSDMRSTL